MFGSLLIAASAGLVLSLFGSVTNAQRNGCSAVAYAMDLRTCFKTRDMDKDVMIHNKATIVETSLQTEGILNNPRNVCEQKTLFLDLFGCLGGTTLKCAKEDEERNYLPNATLTQQGLDYFCQNIDDINHDCYNESYGEVFDCVKKLSTKNIKSNDTIATKACTTVDITHDCIHANVQCDEKTRELLLEFQDNYRKPSGCAPPTRSDRKKYIENPTGGSTTVLVSKIFCFCLSFVLILLQTE